MSKSKRIRQPRRTPEQKAAYIVHTVFVLERRGEPATVARIAAEMGISASTQLRRFLQGMEEDGLLYAGRQMRLIAIAEGTPEWWIARYGYRMVYSVILDAVAAQKPGLYSDLAREYGLQMGLPE